MRRSLPLVITALTLVSCAAEVADATWRAVEADYASPSVVAERFGVSPPADPDAIDVVGGYLRLVLGPEGLELDTFSAWNASSGPDRIRLSEAGWPWRRRLLSLAHWQLPERAVVDGQLQSGLDVLREVRSATAQGPDPRPRVDLVVDAAAPHAVVSTVLYLVDAAGFEQVGLVGQGPRGFQTRVVSVRALDAAPPDCRQVAVHAHLGGARAEVVQRPWELGAQGCLWVRRDDAGFLDPGAAGTLLPSVHNRCPEVVVGGGPEVTWAQVHEAVRVVSLAGGRPLLVAGALADRGACLGDLLGLLP